MARTKRGTPPAYRHHKPRNSAKVTINRQDIYLGEFDSPESYSAYAKVLALHRNGKAPDEIKAALNGESSESADSSVNGPTLTVGQLSLRYWTEYARDYYKSSTGLSRGRVANAKSAVRAINDLFANLPIGNFTTQHFCDIRQSMIDRELSRSYINDQMAFVIDLFRWGVEKGVVPVTIPQALREVKRLRKGKSDAKETEPIEPVTMDDLETALAELQPTLRDMVRVQLLMGARPNEVCMMRVGEITIRTDGAWCYRPPAHKTTHKGKERRLFIGPQSQDILRPYLEGRNADEFVFTHSWKGERQRYRRESYTRAITRACKRAGIPTWTANQLRHTRATDVRSKYDLETAAAVLGHSSPDVTLIYAETNFKKAAEVALKTG